MPPGEPVVIAGDLNVEYYLDSAAGTIGSALEEASRVVGGRLVPDGAIHGPTIDAATNPFAARDSPGYRNVLDYVGSMDADGRPPLAITTETCRFAPGGNPSDHFPVLATIGAH